MLPVGFEPAISADERPQTYALDRAATGTGSCVPDLTGQKLKSCKIKLIQYTVVSERKLHVEIIAERCKYRACVFMYRQENAGNIHESKIANESFENSKSGQLLTEVST